MAFKFIRPVADGTFQYVLSRQIEDPDVINLNDTPSNGITGEWNNNITGSLQAMEFEVDIDEQILLPTEETIFGKGTEFLFDGIGQTSSTAKDIMFETWMKITPSVYEGGTVMDWFDATVQRNELTTTYGFDGIYSNRLVYTDPDGDSTSGWFVDFQFASASNMAWSCSSNNPLTEDTWHHIMTSYTSGDPDSTGLMSIYVDGVLDRQVTLSDLDTWANGNTFELPPTAEPLAFRGGVSFKGKLDEMRLWINTSGSPDSINTLASVTSIGAFPEDMNNITEQDFAPSGDKMVGWWRFESISAFEIFAAVPGSILDSTDYGHNGTPLFFEGSTDFSDEQHGIFGGASAFPLLKPGTPDNGGLLVVDNLNTSITIEEGVDNIVDPDFNTWSVIGDAEVRNDDKQIWSGTSGVKVQTYLNDAGVQHEVNYHDFFYDKNNYTCSLRMLHTSGSVSAKVSFSMGHPDNVVSTTAVINKRTWTPVVLRNSVCADFNASTITGLVTVTQLSDVIPSVSAIENGMRFNIDGLMIQEGDYYSAFVAPKHLRKSGQIHWKLSD